MIPESVNRATELNRKTLVETRERERERERENVCGQKEERMTLVIVALASWDINFCSEWRV